VRFKARMARSRRKASPMGTSSSSAGGATAKVAPRFGSFSRNDRAARMNVGMASSTKAGRHPSPAPTRNPASGPPSSPS